MEGRVDVRERGGGVDTRAARDETGDTLSRTEGGGSESGRVGVPTMDTDSLPSACVPLPLATGNSESDSAERGVFGGGVDLVIAIFFTQ